MVASFLGCVFSPETRKKTADPQAAFDQHIKLAMQYIGSKSRDLARVHLQKAERFESKANRSQLYNGYALLYQMGNIKEVSFRVSAAGARQPRHEAKHQKPSRTGLPPNLQVSLRQSSLFKLQETHRAFMSM